MLDSSELFSAIGGDKYEEPDQNIIERFRIDESLDVPVELTDLDLWSNYVNDDLYVMDKKIREYLTHIKYRKIKKGGFRTTASAVFAWIYGRQPEPADGAACRIIHRLLKYYCTEYTGRTTYNGKEVPRVYKFTKYAGDNKRPYSLKLRLEEAKPGNAIWRAEPNAGKSKRSHGRSRNKSDGSSKDE